MITSHQTDGLKEALQDAGMTQRALAQALNRPDATVNRWANGLIPATANRREIIRAINRHRKAQGQREITEMEVWS